MNKDSAKQLIKETLQNPFDKGRFVYFIKNLLNHIEPVPFIYRGNFIPDAYKSYIKTLERVGKYQDKDDKKIDLLIVHLKKEKSLERARTMQRNFIAWYLNGSRGDILKDAALVAFVSPNSDDWRFSLVKMDYILDASEEKVKVKQELTPVRRFSFLVGKTESSHTAQSCLVPILQDDDNNSTLKDLENAFSIEKVTKEFFEKYRALFLKVREALDEIVKKDKRVGQDFKEKNIDTVDFAKKLLGQIVFLYFLQKKGWFGVERNEDWGTGPKNFLRLLFEKGIAQYDNFFNEILEPLFYEALRHDRSYDDHYFSYFKCKIPFLNGGLFDPINDYNWSKTDIFLPNKLFSNDEKTKEGDIGTGVLDIFDRYNFTVKEDEPLEKEVAVDPEMLGKVFENLLKVKDRKSKGTYYTPREIVHYMCQQSLINYLATELKDKAKREDIEILIRYGETAVEHDNQVINKGKETERYSYKLPQSIRKHAKLIDKKLALIRVCDPAIGSGAFLVGMMNEIVRARNALTNYIKDGRSRTIYNFKRCAIQNCLYGVDIDPGAVEIAKLRLWLSLIVDEEDIQRIKPLPNLDYKIMQGNSLIELLSPEFLAKSVDQEREKLINKFSKVREEFFEITSSRRKNERRQEINELIQKIFNYDKKLIINNLKQLIKDIRSQGRLFQDKKLEQEDKKRIKEIENKIKEFSKVKNTGPSDHFEWRLNFSEVFREKNGFDVVIANPPYVRQEEIKDQKQALQKQGYDVYNSTSDLYTYFYERGYQILKLSGFSCFISSNKWMRAKYGEKLRKFFKERTVLKQIIDFNGYRVFDATVDTNILLFQKIKPSRNIVKILNIQPDFTPSTDITNYFNSHKLEMKQSELNSNCFIFGDKKILNLKKKIEEKGIPLRNWDVKIYRGIITGFNKAFIIDTETKEKLCSEDPKSAEIIKPILRGRDIYRYGYKWAGLWLIKIESRWTDKNRNKKAPEIFFKESYPAVYKHLKTFDNIKGKGKGLYNRDDHGDYWWELRDCDYYPEFKKEKIVYPVIGTKGLFTLLDTQCFYHNDKVFMIVGNNLKYLTVVLNSKLCYWYLLQIGSKLGEKGFEFRKIYVEQLPIPKIPRSDQKPFIDLVDKILAITKSNDYFQNETKQKKVKAYEHKIDQLIYKLYGLTEEEIKIIEYRNQ